MRVRKPVLAIVVVVGTAFVAAPAASATLTIAPTGSWSASATNLEIDGTGMPDMACPSTISGTINANGTGQVTSWTIGPSCAPIGCSATVSGLPASFSLDTEDTINTSGNRASGWVTAGSLAINTSCLGTSCTLRPSWNLPLDLVEGPSRFEAIPQGWGGYPSCPSVGAVISGDFNVTSPAGGLAVTPTFNSASVSPAGALETATGSFRVDGTTEAADITCSADITGTVAANGTGEISQWVLSGCQNATTPPTNCTGTVVGLPYAFTIGNPYLNAGGFGLGTAPQFSFDCGTDDCTFTAPPNGLSGGIYGGTPGYLSFFERPLNGGVCQGAGLYSSYNIDTPTTLSIF